MDGCILDRLRALACLRGIGDDAVARLARGARLREYTAPEMICWMGEGRGLVHAIVAGAVRLRRVLSDGREFVPRYMYAGQLLVHLPRTAYLEAAGRATTVVLISRSSFVEARRAHPDLDARMYEAEDEWQNHLAQLAADLAEPRVAVRVASRLGTLAGERGDGRVFHTCGELGEMTGVDRKTVGRALDLLTELGIIARDGGHGHRQCIVVTDAQKLAEYCAG